MASIIASLPDHVRDYIQQEIAEGRFESEEAVIVRAVEQRMETGYRWEEDETLLDAIAEIDRGEGIVVTDIAAYFAGKRGEIMAAVERGDEVRDDLKY